MVREKYETGEEGWKRVDERKNNYSEVEVGSFGV